MSIVAVGSIAFDTVTTRYGTHERMLGGTATYFGLAAFSAGAAGAQNIETLLILRFFAGAFGSSPLTNSGGVIADMFSAKGMFMLSLNSVAGP